MKNHKMISGFVILAVLIFLTLGVFANDGKMPITTTSEKALEYFIQGRDLFEKLRFPNSRQYFERAVVEDSNFAVGYLNLAFVMPSAKGFFENLEKAKNVMVHASEAEQMWILGAEAR